MPRKPHHTKDESFVIALYEEALENNDPEGAIDRYQAGNRAGLNPKGVDAICKLLVQANFVKKASETEIYLTQRGIALAQQLLME